MEELLTTVSVLTNSNTDKTHILLALTRVSRDINYSSLKKVISEKIISYFEVILKFLVTVERNSSSDVKVSACNACGNFLIHVFPFYPNEIKKAYCNITLYCKENDIKSLIVASVFVFIVKHTKKVKLKKFISDSNALIHFTDTESYYFDHIPTLITALGKFDEEWTRNLLKTFIEEAKNQNTNRFLMKSIQVIVTTYKTMLDDVLQPFMSLSNPPLVFISYIASNEEIFGEIKDKKKIVISAIAILKTSKQFAELDAAFRLLSFIKEVQYEIKDNETLRVIFEDSEVSLDFNNIKDIHSLYKLPIPEILHYNENNSINILTAKWETSGKLGIVENFKTYYPGAREELISPYLQGVSHLIKYCPKEKDAELSAVLKGCLFREQKTWFHSYEILKVLKNLSYERSLELLGQKLTNEIVSISCSFLKIDNEKLTNETILFLSEFAKSEAKEKLLRNIDYFDTELICKVSKLFELLPDDDYSQSFCTCLAESISYHESSVETISQIFLTLYKHNFKAEGELIASIACRISCVSLMAMLGKKTKYVMPEVNNYIAAANHDITTGVISYRNVFRPLYASLFILSTYEAPMFETLMCAKNSFLFLAKPASIIIKKFWSSIKKSTTKSFIDLVIKQNNSWDMEYFSEWCEILNNEEYKTKIIEECKSLLMHSEEISDESCAAYISYLTTNDGLKQENIKTIKAEKLENVLRIISKKNPEVYKMFTGKESEEETEVTKGSFVLREITEEERQRAEMHVKLQIPTCALSDEELEDMLKMFLKTKDSLGLDLIFKYTSTRQRILLFLDFEIPEELLPKVFDYIIYVKSPESRLIGEKYIDNTNIEVSDKANICNTTQLINKIKAGDFKKKDLRRFMRIATSIEDNTSLLSNISLESLNNSTTTKELYISVTITYLIASIQPTLSSDFLSKLEKILISKIDLLPILETSRLIQILHDKNCIKDSTIKLIKKILPLCGQNTTPGIHLKMVLINMKEKPKISQSMQIFENLLLSPYSSMLTEAFTMFYINLTSMSDSNSITYVKKFLPTILQKTETFIDMPYFVNIANNILTFILSRSSLSQFHPIIAAEADKLIPQKTHPSFQAFIHLIPRLIAMGACAWRTENICILPTSIDLFKVELMCLRESIEREKDPEEKSNIIYDSVTSWLDTIKGNDSPAMGEIIYEWENLILQYLGVKQVMTIVCYQFYKYIPRFFPLFTGVGRFLMKLKKSKKDISKEISLIKSLFSVRAHAKAIELLDDPKTMITALQLASFDSDCEESDAMIANL